MCRVSEIYWVLDPSAQFRLARVRSASQGKEAGTENPWPHMPWPVQVWNLTVAYRLGPPPMTVVDGRQLRTLVAGRQPDPEFAL